MLGERAYAEISRAALPDVVPLHARAQRYPRLAAEVLQWGPAGSSAGGEHPKFLATRGDGAAVLVKFSPPLTDRIADLLCLVAPYAMNDSAVPSLQSPLVGTSDLSTLTRWRAVHRPQTFRHSPRIVTTCAWSL